MYPLSSYFAFSLPNIVLWRSSILFPSGSKISLSDVYSMLILAFSSCFCPISHSCGFFLLLTLNFSNFPNVPPFCIYRIGVDSSFFLLRHPSLSLFTAKHNVLNIMGSVQARVNHTWKKCLCFFLF